MLMFPVVKVPIDKVKPYPLNAKKHPNQQIELLAKQIANGFDQPIVVDKDYVIIKGHGRLLACKSLGMAEVDVIVRDDLSPDEVKATRIADNKLAETDWDLEVLAQDLEGFESGVNLEEIGFSEDEIKELERLTEGFNDGFDEDEEELEELSNQYSHKIDAPIYEPSDTKPSVSSLYNDTRYNQLINNIEMSNIPKEEKEFLKKSATRHIVFDYRLIADFYAHSDKETQLLMEESALIIIDFDKALRLGYVKLKEEIATQYLEDYGDE